MKKLLTSIFFLGLTVAHAQLNPVKNLLLTGGYQFNNYNCPQFNCFLISWSPPDSSADTLVGYRLYENDTLYLSFPSTTNSYGCPGFPTQGCSMNTPDFLWFLPPNDAHPFYATVKAVYNKDSSLSIATDSLYFGGVAIGINEQKSQKDFSTSPNPFSAQTIIQITNYGMTNYEFEMYDVFGRMVKQFVIRNSPFVIERGNLPSGLYFIRLAQEDKTFATEKIVITDN